MLFDFIHTFTNEIKKSQKYIPNCIKEVYYKILLLINDAARKRGLDYVPNKDTNNFVWDRLARYHVIDQIEDYLIDIINKYFSELEDVKSSSKIISRIIKYIKTNYGDLDLSIKKISESLSYSDTYLCVVFKKETGKTINQYIREVRINEAKEIFKDDKMPIYNVAKMVGYSDPNYFTKIFKKATDMTPSQYREKYNL